MQQNNVTVAPTFFLLGFQSSSRMFLFCLLLVAYFGTICGNLLIITLVSTSKILHTPMYFFISHLSVSDILLITDIVPNLLHILLSKGGAITFIGCFTQFWFFGVVETFECLLLAVMSYDRYVAICNPLRYPSIMTNGQCVKLVITSWLVSFSFTLIDALTISVMTYCGPNVIDHIFCDLLPLIEIACSDTNIVRLEVYILSFPVLFIPITIIIISYINIIATIFRLQSRVSRQKAFSTCSSHLTVVSIFYFTIFGVYVFPTEGQILNMKKILSLLYTVLTPLINPIIYSLRNKDIKTSLQERIKFFCHL
ncbi:olfactory receptor 11L1-like [Dendropsophus ebraccatus]|uniref:olfactory receptor 11L1-like n=1 Tax=Dendropsophus ebraccatus TaxID=150705 RepID=UPI003832160D